MPHLSVRSTTTTTTTIIICFLLLSRFYTENQLSAYVHSTVRNKCLRPLSCFVHKAVFTYQHIHKHHIPHMCKLHSLSTWLDSLINYNKSHHFRLRWLRLVEEIEWVQYFLVMLLQQSADAFTCQTIIESLGDFRPFAFIVNCLKSAFFFYCLHAQYTASVQGWTTVIVLTTTYSNVQNV